MGLTNFVDGRVEEVLEGRARVSCDSIGATLTASLVEEAGLTSGKPVTISVRPETIRILDEAPGADMENVLDATVNKVSFLGNMLDYRLKVQEIELRVQELTGMIKDFALLHEGTRVKIWLNPNSCSLIS